MIRRYSDIVVLLLWCFSTLSDGQDCISTTNIYVRRRRYTFSDDSQVIIPAFSFNCNGRITGVSAGMHMGDTNGYMPEFQVWRPLSPDSNEYSKINQVKFQAGTPITDIYYVSSVLLTGNDELKFQSGDVLGYYQPTNSFLRISNIINENYTSYSKNYDNLTTTNINSGSYYESMHQPLINVFTDIQCDDLSTPANGEITSCSSGRVGVGYERDTCSFTCNTGYELTGSDTRTCQSDGSWSGSDDVCQRVLCLPLTIPNNGLINCSLGNDEVPFYEDTCSFTCNTGYELAGSDTRTCQSDGNWSGIDAVCQRVLCLPLTNPNNGLINCSLGDDEVPFYEDTCSFTCNTSYELTGSDTRTCQSDGSWSGSDAVCRPSEIRSASQDSSSGSGSSGAAIGGAVGGILFIIIVIIVAIIVLYIRHSQRRKAHSLEEAKNNKNDYQNINNDAFEQSGVVTPSSKPAVYEGASSSQYSILDAALSSMNGICPQHYESSMTWYEVSGPLPQDLTKSMEEEEEIYNTPYEDEQAYGPVYHEPPSDERKIYAEFEGKRFRKLYHKEIWSFEELGTGEFGTVTHCKWKPSKHKEVEVAVKTLNSNVSDKDRLRFLQEAAIICQFDHQNVIKLHGVVTEAPIMIVLEYMHHGDLKNMLMQLQPMSGITTHAKLPLILLKFCKEIAAGMTYLSGKQFIHRDLAARNILVSENITCKIADFGMSRDLINDNYYITSGGKVPVKWTAPEALQYRKYSLQSDVWSYGCVLYEIWSLGYKPFEELSNMEVIEKVDSGYRLPPPPGCPRTIYRIMMKCWHPDPRSRPQFGQITKLLAGNNGYLLGWSNEDKQISGEDAMKLGAPLESAINLYYDLQLQYKQIER